MGRPLPFKVIFMGSPLFSAIILEGLIKDGIIPSLVLTQEDKKGKRGHLPIETEVKKMAKGFSISVKTPNSLRSEEVIKELKSFSPDFIVVAAYGKILPKEVLAIPKIAPINVHASFLPRWRGASPIQHTILSGDEKTGITIMKMDEGVDSGPIYLKSEEVLVQKDETSESLSIKLAEIGSKILPPTLHKIFNNELEPKPQEGEASYAKKIKKEDGLINFKEDAILIERKVRAFYPWPIAHFYLKGVRINVYKAEVGESGREEREGVLLSSDKLWFSCKGGSSIIFKKVQREGKKILNDEEFLKGFRIEKGELAENSN